MSVSYWSQLFISLTGKKSFSVQKPSHHPNYWLLVHPFESSVKVCVIHLPMWSLCVWCKVNITELENHFMFSTGNKMHIIDEDSLQSVPWNFNWPWFSDKNCRKLTESVRGRLFLPVVFVFCHSDTAKLSFSAGWNHWRYWRNAICWSI